MTGKPPISSDNSRMSLVVPGTGVTIAASLFADRSQSVFDSEIPKHGERTEKIEQTAFSCVWGPEYGKTDA